MCRNYHQRVKVHRDPYICTWSFDAIYVNYDNSKFSNINLADVFYKMEKAFELVKLEPYEITRSISCWKMPKNLGLLGFTKESKGNSLIFTKYEQIPVGAPKMLFLG